MNVADISGTKSRRLIRGMVAKNILSNADIEGSSPKLDKVIFFTKKFICVDETQALWFNGLQRC